MKVLTVLGTRPEIIRLSLVIEKLDRFCDHFLLHTGQNFDPNLNEVFFKDLSVRQPDEYLNARGPVGEQMGTILAGVEARLQALQPDRLLILGDTNSALAAIIAKRMGVSVYHMEAGNRCYDDRVPEEVNRRIIDHCSDVLMPYTERSRQNLLREGFPGERIFVTGNPIREVILRHQKRIDSSKILEQLNLAPKGYFLVTLHRAENVDPIERLKQFTQAFQKVHQHYALPVIVSTHPRTRNRMLEYGLTADNKEIRYLSPFGFFDFVHLEQNAFCVLSDSGTVQEECAIFGVPNVTLRDVTERPETLECGSNILSGSDPKMISNCIDTVLELKPHWSAPPEYLVEDVSSTVIKILMGYLHTCP